LTVVDATNVQPESRKSLVEIAREFHCLPVAIVLDLPERVAHDRNKAGPDRDFGPHVIRQQSQQLRRSLRGLDREGFRHVFVLKSPEEIEAAVIERQPLWNNLKHEHGPFDIIGDVHGCYDELTELLGKLGYTEQPGGSWRHPRRPRNSSSSAIWWIADQNSVGGAIWCWNPSTQGRRCVCRATMT
jgi:protein phosphatase